MEILTKPKAVQCTVEELLNHKCWSEALHRRRKVKGHGNRVFRQFHLVCGDDCEIVCYLSEVIGFSLGSCKFTKPFVEVQLQTMERYGVDKKNTRFIHLKLLGSDINRTVLKRDLYRTLCQRFPMTDWDVQECKVEEV